MERRVKYNELPGLADLDDKYQFRLIHTADFSTGSTGNCGVQAINSVHVGWRIKDYGQLPARHDVRDDWGSPTREVQEKLQAHIRELTKTTSADSEDAIIQKLLKQAKDSGCNCFFLTDCCNRNSGFRGSGQKSFGTAELGELLFRRKIGYVVRSPVSLNYVHRSASDFSLVRNYLWYPPGAIAFKDGKYLGAGTIAESAKAYHDGLAKYTSIPWYPGVGLNDKIEDKLKQLYDRIVLWKTTPEERKAKQNQGG